MKILFRSAILALSLYSLIPTSALAARSFKTDILHETFHFNSRTPHTVPFSAVHQGCPKRDCIPAIDKPRFVVADKVRFLDDADIVLSLTHNGVTKAYPVRIMNYHEIVNDKLGGDPLAITYCPLCGSGIAFSRRLKNKVVEFGVSGVLYNSDLVMYDRYSNTLWSQVEAAGIIGRFAGTHLQAYPMGFSRWSEWKAAHPKGLVLSPDTGFDMPYKKNPYTAYENSGKVIFPVSARDARHYPKMVVYGFILGNQAIAYDAKLLESGEYRDKVGDVALQLTRGKDGSMLAKDLTHDKLYKPARLYWFAWYTFHPDTLLRVTHKN